MDFKVWLGFFEGIIGIIFILHRENEGVVTATVCRFLSISHQPNSSQVGIKRFGHYTVALISAIQAVQLHENICSKHEKLQLNNSISHSITDVANCCGLIPLSLRAFPGKINQGQVIHLLYRVRFSEGRFCCISATMF